MADHDYPCQLARVWQRVWQTTAGRQTTTDLADVDLQKRSMRACERHEA